MRGSGGEAEDHPAGGVPPGPRSSGSMYWLLLALALAGFLPCVLLPPWRDYQAVALAAQLEERQAAAVRESLQQRRRAIEAIRTDPAVAARLAQRELAYVRLGETQVEVPGVEVAAVPVSYEPEPVTPVQPPAAVAGMLGRLPRADYDALFCEEPARTTLTALSGGVLVAAFVLCPPRTRRPQTEARSPPPVP